MDVFLTHASVGFVVAVVCVCMFVLLYRTLRLYFDSDSTLTGQCIYFFFLLLAFKAPPGQQEYFIDLRRCFRSL